VVNIFNKDNKREHYKTPKQQMWKTETVLSGA
jgi:hypothetical protein